MGHKLLPGHPELYHGKEGSGAYFEGWYFKHASKAGAFSVIPGVYRGRGGRFAFIQVIFGSPAQSFFVRYPFDAFYCGGSPFTLRLGENTFSLSGAELDIKEIGLCARLEYGGITPLKTSLLSPSVMGYFSYFPAMQCSHGVLSLRHSVNGEVSCEGRRMVFEKGCGYIEKDWGEAFPKSWIWMQCCDGESSLMCAAAIIPYGPFNFGGIICAFESGGEQRRFATYNGAKLVSLETRGAAVFAAIRRKEWELRITARCGEYGRLLAPSKTGMDREITESLSVEYETELLRENEAVFSRRYKHGGLEMAQAEGLLKARRGHLRETRLIK